MLSTNVSVIPNRDAVHSFCARKYRTPSSTTNPIHSANTRTCQNPPAPSANTTAAKTNSTPATSARNPPLNANASSASDSSTRPSNCPAPSVRTSSGSSRNAPASNRSFSNPPPVIATNPCNHVIKPRKGISVTSSNTQPHNKVPSNRPESAPSPTIHQAASHSAYCSK